MITLDEALNYLKLEREDLPKQELAEIEGLALAASEYLKNATGVTFSEDNALAKLFCRMLIGDWYEERGTVDKIKDGARAILTQLKNSYPQGGGALCEP